MCLPLGSVWDCPPLHSHTFVGIYVNQNTLSQPSSSLVTLVSVMNPMLKSQHVWLHFQNMFFEGIMTFQKFMTCVML